MPVCALLLRKMNRPSEHLKVLEAKGVKLIVCGTCLNFYGLTDKLQCGTIGNMYDIVETMTEPGKVITVYFRHARFAPLGRRRRSYRCPTRERSARRACRLYSRHRCANGARDSPPPGRLFSPVSVILPQCAVASHFGRFVARPLDFRPASRYTILVGKININWQHIFYATLPFSLC